MSRENNEDHPSNIQARNTISPRIQQDYITQASEEIEDNMSQEFNKTESRILGALSRLYEFHQNSQARDHSGPVLETSRNLSRRNQGTNDTAPRMILILKWDSL